MSATTSSAATPRWLKQGLHRSVSLRPGPDGAPEVVKHYRSSSWLRRLGDRRRAERELRLLRELHAAGLRVPRPRGTARGERGWELRAEWIEGARDLGALLRAPREAPTTAEALARRLGALVGHAHALGLDHGDLHAGNLLVDARGEVWLVDLASARRPPRLTDDRLERDLVGLAADAREFTTLAQRRRFLVAWRAQLPPERRARFRERTRLAELERRARTRRREALLEHADRWTRPSGLCTERRAGEVRTLVARCGAESAVDGADALARLVALAATDVGAAGAPLADRTLVFDRSPGAARRWTTLGRAWQHGLPTLTPLALVAVPTGDVGVHAVPAAGGAADAGDLDLGALDAELRERGFAPVRRGLWRDADGSARLSAGADLEPEASE